MSEQHATIIFVAGPQKGERALLTQSPVLCGRDMAAGLHIQEQVVSRQQMLLELLPDGWSVRNLSKKRKIKVNGKKYKAGKVVLLDSGDVIDIGEKTGILFASPDDDPEEVLDAYLEKTGRKQEPQPVPVPDDAGAEAGSPDGAAPPAPGQPSPEAGVETPEQVAVSPAFLQDAREAPGMESPAGAGAGPEGGEEQEQLSPQELEEQQRKAKLKKYAVAGGVYLGLMVMVFLALWAFGGGDSDGNRNTGRPPELERRHIDSVFTYIMERPTSRRESQEYLDKARSLYLKRHSHSNPENMYLCQKNYRLYLAYVPRGVFAKTEDERKYREVLNELTDTVYREVKDMYALVYSREWRKARGRINTLLDMIPPGVCGDDPKTKRMVENNLLPWQSYIAGNLLRSQGED